MEYLKIFFLFFLLSRGMIRDFDEETTRKLKRGRGEERTFNHHGLVTDFKD